jgi:hypothetical protein
MLYSVTYEIQQNSTTLPIVFVKRKDAVAYAKDNGITDYKIIRDTDRLKG